MTDSIDSVILQNEREMFDFSEAIGIPFRLLYCSHINANVTIYSIGNKISRVEGICTITGCYCTYSLPYNKKKCNQIVVELPQI